jgi:hypothetical protein
MPALNIKGCSMRLEKQIKASSGDYKGKWNKSTGGQAWVEDIEATLIKKARNQAGMCESKRHPVGHQNNTDELIGM